MMETGSLFLVSLRRRAYGDERLQLVITTFLMLVALIISHLGETPAGNIGLLGGSGAVVTTILGLAAWMGASYALNFYARQAMRSYAANLLTDTGLLYLVIEHEPAEYLPIGRGNAFSRKLKLQTHDAISFKGRILSFLRNYYRCTSRIGFHGAPRNWRLLELSISLALVISAVLFGWLVFNLVLKVERTGTLVYPVHLKPLFIGLLSLILSRSILQIARRTGLWLGLTDLLLPEGAGERAIYAGH